jgi:DNA polymerase
MDLIELQDTAAKCRECELCENRKMAVFAKGSPDAKIMICGMCPGPDENEPDNAQGWPFVGRAGQLLDQILEDTQLTLKDVYITNVVKCYLKPGIRLEDDWIDKCFPYLINQVALIQPKVVLALGSDAARALLNKPKSTSLGSMRDKRYKLTDETSIIVTYHPSYFLRSGGRKHKHYGRILEDISWAKEVLKN